MGKLKELDRVRHQAEKCVSCGLCLFSCPVYAEELDENYVARGRNRLVSEILENYKDLQAGDKDRFSKCTLCRRCTMVCPHEVRTDLLVVAARAELAKGAGLPFYKEISFRRLLKDRNRMRNALKAGSKLQRLLPVTREPGRLRHIPSETEGKIRHIPHFLLGRAGGRQLPSIAKQSLSELIPEVNPAPAKSRRRNMRVAYFSGCATEFIFPRVGRNLIKILNQSGVEVIFPQQQGCCGIAVFSGGDLETGRQMALHNLEVFSRLDADLVVTGCATCGSALKDGWASHLAKDEREKARFEAFGRRVRDISELLVELADFKPLRFRSILPENTRVTYHDPCHLARYQGISEEPRKILRQVFGHRFIEMDNTGCCGMGGTFNIDHYDLSKKIAKNKTDSIARTGADIVINTCPGCMIQLIDNIERHHLPQRVVNLVEAVEPMPEPEA